MSAVETGTLLEPSRRRSPRTPGRGLGTPTPARSSGRLVPYLLVAPTVLVLAAVQGWPLIKMVMLSFQDLELRHLFSGTQPPWIGFANYSEILTDAFFWQVVFRTVVFTVVNVALTVLLATGVALLMRRTSTWCRTLLMLTLICVWAMPTIVSTLIFNWMTDVLFGVANWMLSLIPGVDLVGHNWFINPIEGFGVITAIVIWGAIPFVAITLYAGLMQVPRELEEAARVDGASAFQVFRNVTYPVLRPLYVITITLSVIWDFQVFNQIWVARGGEPGKDYWTLGIYSFIQSFGVSEYSLGSAIAVVTVLMLMVFTLFYVRRSLRHGEFE